VRLEIAPCLLTRYQRVGRNLAIERELIRLVSPPDTVPRAKRPDAGTQPAF